MESDHDLQQGVLSYVYDFADGDPITTNVSSIVHKWNNGGEYKVTVTVIDDQGALDQESKTIQINNKPPDAYFTFGPAFAENNTQSTYYGTYDFRGDVIGDEPEDWEVYDWKDAALKSETIRPNGDILTEWLHIPTPHWSRVNESGEPDGDYFETTWYGATHQKERLAMGTVDLNGGAVAKIVLHAYGKVYDYYYPMDNSQPSSNIYLGGWKGDKIWNFPQGSYGWRTLTWDNLHASQAELDNLQIQFKSDLEAPYAGYSVNYIDTVYCEVYYTYDMHVTVVNDTGYYGQVVQLYDDESQEHVWVENELPVAQTHGSIEFYVKSDEASEQTWSLSLYDGSTIGLKLLMGDDQWKYYNGSSGAITECGTPSDDQWYWVRLDFCTSDTYLGLTAHQYRLTVDSSESNIYYFKDINQINKIRFESGEPDTGTARIDAIGFTWSPYYNLNDNKYTVISYPEKTNVQFVANSSDTESDLGPMRYYWDFGDGSSGWGKNTFHNYLESGIYIVNLTCKDDNGITDWHSEMVIIHNYYPSIMNITCPVGSMSINEGETILFNALPMDDESDLSRLSYWWDFDGYNFDPYNTSHLEAGGWIKPHLYMDDFIGDMHVLVKDPETAFGYKAVSVNVSNVDPLLSIWDASILSNISFEVYRSHTQYDADFTFDLVSNGESLFNETLSFTGSQDNLIYSNKTEIAMTLSKIWEVRINSSDVLPSGSWFRCYVKLNFLHGEELVLSSDKLYGGQYGLWEVDLNPYFYDQGDYTFMYPITFDAHIWDPSVDDITLSIQYNVSMSLIIECDDTLPVEDTFTLNNVNYIINVYTEDGIEYANITASQQVFFDTYNDNDFPVCLDVNFTIYPIIDLYELLEIQMDLSNLTILHCDTALNYLIGEVSDDDYGEGALTITFTTEDNIEFQNLSPYPEFYIPDQGLEGTNITFYIDISDFDQIRLQEDYYVANYQDYDIPTMPDDFELINGTCDNEGDLLFQDNQYATFTPDGTEDFPSTYSFDGETVGTSGTNIEFVDDFYGTGCSVEIIQGIDGHNKVLKTHDTDSYTAQVIHYFDTAQQYGTIEFWWRTSDSTHNTNFQPRSSDGSSILFRLRIDSDILEYYDGSWHTIISQWNVDNEWHHYRVDFERTSGNYGGLSQNKWQVWVDGSKYGSYNFESNIDPSRLYLNNGDSENDVFYDSFGFSWDSGYNIGDNIYWNNYRDVSSDFENEDTYTSGTDIDFIDVDASETNCKAQIIPSFNKHKKVIELYDNNGAGNCEYHNDFSSAQGYGTIEYWVKTSDATLLNDVRLFNGATRVAVLAIDSDMFRYYDGEWHDVNDGLMALDDTWYHIRIDFECTAGGYKGLAQFEWRTYINGKIYGDYNFENNETTVDTLWLITSTGDSGYYSYYDAFGYSWDSNYNIGDNLCGTCLLNSITTFQLDIENDEIIKYLKLSYAYKVEFSALVNISIYNFHPDIESWTLIDSSKIDTTIYRNKYSILNAEFINDTGEILIKIESDYLLGKFFLDQFRLEYFTSQVSDYGSFEHEYIPDQPYDFTIYGGLSDWGGDLESIDNSYTTFSPSIGNQMTDIIRPDGDITTEWLESTPHYSRLDEEISDGDSITTFYSDKTEEFNFNSLSDVVTVTKIEVKMYAYRQNWDTSQPKAQIFIGGWQVEKTCSWGFIGYSWSSVTWEGLDASLEELDGFRFKIRSRDTDWLHLDTLYAIVTYVPKSSISFASELHLDGVRPIDQIDSVELLYSYKTNISTDIDLSLFNYSSGNWEVVNTSTYIQFSNCSYKITESDYFSPYYDIRVKFNGTIASTYEIYLEKLKLHYEWTKGSYEDDYLYSDYPDYPTDFNIYDGTCDSEGCFEAQDDNFYTFNSTTGGDLNYYAILTLEAAQPGDLIKSLWLNYSYKTDNSQTIEISLYNFTANEWYLIDSSIHTSFSNESYVIPISRIEIVNGTEIEYHDFYNTDFDIFVQFCGENQVSKFQLFVDQLKVEYTIVSYLFTGDSSRLIDAVEGDYISFDSEEPYPYIYYGTYSFENDEVNATGTDISFVDIEDTGDDCFVSVVESFDYYNTKKHHKVIKLYDNSLTDNCNITNNFASAQSYGTIEFWEQSTSTYNLGPVVELKDASNNLLLAYRIYYYKHQRYTGSSWSDMSTEHGNEWIHIRIDFETTNGNYTGLSENTYKIYIDGVGYGPYSVVINDVSPSKINIYTDEDDSSWSVYLDAIGYSWDPNYNVGDNRYAQNRMDDTLTSTLGQLNSHRLGLFESCEISYSINTSLSQEMLINIYNYTGDVWTTLASLTTDNSKLYNGLFVLTDTDFISEDYKVKVQFLGINYSGNAYTLHIYKLEAKYDWSIARADCGVSFLSCPLRIDYNMSSRYSTMFFEDFTFDYAGMYLITMSSDDGYFTTSTGMLIEITTLEPFAEIGDFVNETIEDQNIYFDSEVSNPGSNVTESEFRYFWLFGDGSFSNDPEPVHAYAESGFYNISLTIVDCYGNTFTKLRNITILEKAPEIVGPYTFYGVEGQAIILDVDIFDAFLDEVDMDYEWFNANDDLISTDKRPSLVLQDGFYEYTLNVTDSLGQTATANISVVVEDAPPVVIAQNFMYSGASVVGDEGFFAGSADDPGELVLTAYGYDTCDNNDLDYHWTVYKGDEIFDGGIDYNIGITSSRKFRVTDTMLYRGEVKIVSGEKSTIATFLINSLIDDNGNGFSNEFEERLAETGENITAYSDADNDCLSDLYEIGISNTSYLDPDTDGDGLYDGFDADTGIGEWTAGTDPLNWDCDSDFLSDGIEVVGWKMSNELLGEVIVSSDPWDNTTDDDGLTDYDEYYSGTDPRNGDTDNDGANDDIDPHPLKWDGDEDGLCDGLELQLGTNPNNTDSDSDGISDGEEVIGWAFTTNPLTSDSDRDFIADTAEYQNYKVAIDDRYDLNDPISLLFEVNCEKAMAAQIAFLITFGEAIDESGKEYGVQDIPDLNVTIYKVDDDLLLFNMTTNSTRYFSQVVDIRETMENHSLDYRGEYMIKINNTEAGCLLEQFEIDITGYLDPNDEDFDDDGIMDGIEMGLLVRGEDTLNFTDSYLYDNLTVNEKYVSEGGDGSGLVTSVEHVEITLGSGVTSNYATLSKGQDISNCVPFATVKLNTYGDDWDENMVDLYFVSSPDTRVVAERGEGGGTVVVSVYVVEFDSTRIKVQSDSFSTSNSYIDKSITSVNTSKAVTLAYWKITGNDDDWDCAMVTTDFVGSNTVRMERDRATGTITGHYYVFEAVNSEFSVQKGEMSMSSSDDFVTVSINSVDMSKSFTIASYEVDEGNDDVEEGALDIWLNSETEVRAERRPEANSYAVPTINVFVITFDGNGGSSVQRDSFTWANADASKQATISEVDLDVAMVKGGTMYGIMECDGTGSSDPKTSFVQYEFDGSTTVRGERYTNNEDGIGHWEVIEWEFQSGSEYYESEIEPIIDEFYLDISDLGRVYDANITVNIESEGTPIGFGEVNITLIKEELNCSIDDVVLFDVHEEFDNTSSYSFEAFLDLTDYVNNGSISDFYGSYLLKIVISDTNYTHDNFTLSEFYILTDTYINAGPKDTKAWYTDPALPDTDFDGWSDYTEIFNKETNPLNPDTDFDGVWDSFDRDPKRDVMLEISPFSVAVPNDYKLKIVVKFTADGEKYYMPTPTIKADIFEDPLYTAYYDLHYYIDISDDTRVPNKYGVMRFDIELWRVERYWHGIKKWDKKLVSDDEYYYIETPDHDDILTVEKYDDTQLKYQAKVKIKTIGIEKVNTIAVYEINDTSFTGHYQEAERMNIIQLYINDTPPSSSPFVKGANCIVIPTSLYTETILNAYVQTERLNETNFYSSDEEKFKFISIERDGSAEQGCGEVDSVMIRFDISYQDAEDLLDLILTCIVNETLDENNNTVAINAILYTYISTKLNGTSAVMLNLPDAALGYVPWFCENESSSLGGRPVTKDEWFWKPIEDLLNFGKLVLGFILSPFLLPIVIWNLISEYVLEIIKMFILPILEYILWLIIRAILFILFYILLAIEILLIYINVLAIGIPLLSINLLGDVEVSFGLNLWVPYGKNTCVGYYEINSSDSNIRAESWIVWSYWDFFDLYIPLMSDKTMYDNSTIQENKVGVTNDHSESTYKEVEPKASLVNSSIVLFSHTYYNISNTENQFEVQYYDANFEEPDLDYGVRLHLIRPNGTALAYVQMTANSSVPDYSDSNGVLFNYTLDISNYEDGLWHYYFSAKDKNTGNLTIYPNVDYFVGPDTCGDSHFLWGSRVSISNGSYYNAEGWADDDFYFFVDWWDPVNYSAPTEVNLCLIPANINIGTGLSKNIGIRKFSMQTTVSSPNYTDPVEYYTILNFSELGYADYDIGHFYHYYEAKTSETSILNSLDHNEFEPCHYSDPLVKSIGNPVIQISSYTSSGSSSFITSETEIEYYLIYSDHGSTPPSTTPEISFSCDGDIKSYNMTHYYTSFDNSTYYYYFSATGDSLGSGKTVVDFNFEDLSEEVILLSSEEEYIKEFFVINFLTSALNNVITATSLFGTVPISLFSSVFLFAQITRDSATDKVLYLSGGVLAYVMVAMGLFISSLAIQEDIGGLLGFSIACFLLFVMLQVCVHPKGLEVLNFVKKTGIYLNSIAWIFTTIAALISFIFPGNSILCEILYLVSNLFVIFPVLIGAFVAAFSLTFTMGTISSLHTSAGVEMSNGYKLVYKCFSIYKWVLFVGGIIGLIFLDLILKL